LASLQARRRVFEPTGGTKILSAEMCGVDQARAALATNAPAPGPSRIVPAAASIMGIRKSTRQAMRLRHRQHCRAGHVADGVPLDEVRNEPRPVMSAGKEPRKKPPEREPAVSVTSCI